MKKLKLDLDALEIDTFEPAPLDEAEGTVHGEQFGFTGWLTCRYSCGFSCRGTCGAVSCFFTCQVSCVRTCGVTCDRFTCDCSYEPSCITCGVTCHPALCGRTPICQ